MAEIKYIEINPDTRKIENTAGLLLGILEDKNAERLYFKCSKIVGDNIDLSLYQIYIKYTESDKEGKKFADKLPGIYHCEDVTDHGDYITFTWRMSGNVFVKSGFVAFSMLASDGEEIGWNTYPAVGAVGLTIPGGLEEIAEEYADVITQMIKRLDALETNGGGSGASTAAAVSYDDTKTKLGAENVQEAIGKLQETIANKTGGSGATTAQANSLWAIIQKTAFTEQVTDEELNIFKTAWGITDDDTGDGGETEVTLSSISATYTGGDVTAGTALTDLTGITVTGTYSDGSTSAITGYTLSGTIAEGDNTITVSYSGLTTIFTVTGVAESSGVNETTAWDNSSEYSFGGIVKNVRNAKATGTFAYQSISTDYIQMFDTGLGDNWEGIVIIDEENPFTSVSGKDEANFSFVNKEGYLIRLTRTPNRGMAEVVNLSAHDYFKIENGVYYAKSLYTSEGYQPFVVGSTCRWFAW